MAAAARNCGVAENGVVINFEHIFSRLNKITFDLTQMKNYVEARGVNCVDVCISNVNITDLTSATYVFSDDSDGNIFSVDSFDQSRSAGVTSSFMPYVSTAEFGTPEPMSAMKPLNLQNGGTSYYTKTFWEFRGYPYVGEGHHPVQLFPGKHTISFVIYYKTSSNSYQSQGSYSGDFVLQRGRNHELIISINPKGNTLDFVLTTNQLEDWGSNEEGDVVL